MKLSLLLQGIRDKVNDGENKQWSDAQITYWINRKQASIFTEMAEADPTYKQTKVQILGTAATQVSSNIWRYVLPSWCGHRVNMVHETTSVTESRKRPVEPIHDDDFYSYGWCWDSDRSFELRGTGEAKDLTLWVSKPPAPLMQGDLDDTGSFMIASKSILSIFATPAPIDSDSNSYEQPMLVDDAYVNSVFEVTQASQANLAFPVRVSSSLVSGVNLLLTIEPGLKAFAIDGHAYEMHAEVEDQHLDYLMLDVAMTLFQKTRNSQGIESLIPMYNTEKRKFINSVQPRQMQMPYRTRKEGAFSSGSSDDQNRDFRW